jgi:hypothetical protein
MNHHHTLINGFVGVLATTGSVITSFQTQLEWWFRMTSLSVGIAVGLITAYKLLTKKKP